MGSMVLKPNARKTRRIGDSAIGAVAGATADAFTLFERLENKLEEHSGQLTRAAVELAKMWRMDKYLRRLDVRAWEWAKGAGGLGREASKGEGEDYEDARHRDVGHQRGEYFALHVPLLSSLISPIFLRARPRWWWRTARNPSRSRAMATW